MLALFKLALMPNTLPAFLAAREQGLFIDAAQLPAPPAFFDFVEQLLNSGRRFADLNYPLFLDALYFPERLNKFAAATRLARGVVPFHTGRQSLYKGVRLLEEDSLAEYFFEPAVMEVEYDHPLYGGADESGNCPITGYEKRLRTQPTMRDLDEFIAAMWIRGIRYGLVLPVISAAIAHNKADRVVIARRLSASPGKNASIEEVFEGLQQSNAPAIVDGKINLKRFQNRYPQVPKDCVMLRKTPMQQGSMGITVRGEKITPEPPKDFDLTTLSGEGTRIEARPEGLALIANLRGFIYKNKESPMMHVVETIETTDAIDAKNTGDLDLSVDDFIAHGEVQEGRIIKGKNMRFNAPVYGNLESQGGSIELQDNVGGSHINLIGVGTIHAVKRVYNTRIEAAQGSVFIHYAENTTIVAGSIQVGEAVNCTLISDRIKVDAATSCHIAAKNIDIGVSRDRRGSPTQATLLLPDTSAIALAKKQKQAMIDNGHVFVGERAEQLLKIKNDPDFAKYLAARQAVQAGKIKLTPEVQARLQQLHRIHAGSFKTIERLMDEIKRGKEVVQRKTEELALYCEEEEVKASGHKCFINDIQGETAVHAKVAYVNLAEFSAKAANTLLTWVQTLKTDDHRIFNGDAGSVAWQFSLA